MLALLTPAVPARPSGGRHQPVKGTVKVILGSVFGRFHPKATQRTHKPDEYPADEGTVGIPSVTSNRGYFLETAHLE